MPETAGNSTGKKKQVSGSLTIRYVGPAAESEVVGLGLFERGKPYTFTLPNLVELANRLVDSNANFEEWKGDEE